MSYRFESDCEEEIHRLKRRKLRTRNHRRLRSHDRRRLELNDLSNLNRRNEQRGEQ